MISHLLAAAVVALAVPVCLALCFGNLKAQSDRLNALADKTDNQTGGAL